MGWSTDDGMHDGHCVAYFPGAAAYAGARVAVGLGTDGVLVRPLTPYGVDATGAVEQLDGRTVTGWGPRCSCGWRGTIWSRTDHPDRHDPGEYRWYVPAGALDAEASAPIALVRHANERWQEHLVPVDRLAGLRGAADQAAATEARLTAQVRAARLEGRSWAEIGAAVGTTRQAAWERWSGEDLAWTHHCHRCGRDSGGYPPRPRACNRTTSNASTAAPAR